VQVINKYLNSINITKMKSKMYEILPLYTLKPKNAVNKQLLLIKKSLLEQ